MKQKYSYAECYKILKVKPDCSWEELRKAYKLQIQKWHPDRFEDGSAEKQAADEKIRYINSAYQQLSDYHRQQGQLPTAEKPAEPPAQRKSKSEAPTTNKHSTNGQFTAQTDTSGLGKPGKASSKFRIFITLVAVATFSYILLSQNPTEDSSKQEQIISPPDEIMQSAKSQAVSAATKTEQEQHNNKQQIDHSSTTTNIENLDNKKNKVNDDEFFTYGSSIGEVISVQGPPSKIEGDIWYYGESEVYFYEGEVVKWKRMPGYPLKAQLVITTPGEDKKKLDKKSDLNSLFD